MGTAAALLAILMITAAPAMAEVFARSWVEVVTASGAHGFRVEVAADPERRTLGLQHRRSLAANAGMLFDFGAPTRVAMWMKNTHVALDMLFAAADGTIVHVARDTTPLSLDVISPPGATQVRYVLEVPAGTAARLGIEVGDRIVGPPLAKAR